MAKAAGKSKSKAAATKPAATAPSTETAQNNGAAPAPAAPAAETPGPVTDETIAQSEGDLKAAGAELDELAALRLKLDQEHQLRLQAERQQHATEDKLSRMVESQAHILVAERVARQAEEELDEATKVQKEKKKKLDAAVADLRQRVRDALDGQMNLFTPKEIGDNVAGAMGAKPTAPKKATSKTTAPPPKPTGDSAAPAPVVPAGDATAAAASSVPADALDDEKGSTDDLPPAQAAPLEWWLKAGLNSVSVPGENAGEMQSLPPAMVKACGDAGIHSVADAKAALDSNTAIKGVGAAGRKKLSGIIEKWIAAESKGESNPPPAQAATDGATHRLCASCNHRWELPSAVDACPQCQESEYIFDVGFYSNPNADEDGDLVAQQDVLPFTVAANGSMAGMDQYQFRVIVAPDGEGKFVGGYEIAFDDSVAESYYPNVRDSRLTRDQAIEQGLWMLQQAVRGILPKKDQQDAWDTAATTALGRNPIKHAEPVTETAA